MTAIDADALAAIRARAAAATPGPWIGRGFGPNDTFVRITQRDGWPDDPVCDVGHNVTNRDADATFIAASRTDVPALLARIDALHAAHAAAIAAARADALREARAACERVAAWARDGSTRTVVRACIVHIDALIGGAS